MSKTRVPLYERLPEIYRILDAEQAGPTPLKAFLALVEEAFGCIHENIESFYDDHFIETCDDWVIPYLADLLGTSHLSGDPWTLRADVADTIALRRRKGTLAAIERLTYDLTGWGVHAVELRRNLVWAQHLNHQRPDAGGDPPYAESGVNRFTVVVGGTAAVRDPATLSLLNTPFDPYAHFADLRPPATGAVCFNVPNLAVFLWRLEAYTIEVSNPVACDVGSVTADGAAPFVALFDIHPLGRPVRLFNRSGYDPDLDPPVVTELDAAPGPMLMAQLTSAAPAGHPQAYVAVAPYDPADLSTLSLSERIGLQLHVPAESFAQFDSAAWSFRGANLCAWERALAPALRPLEVAIDPNIGRLVIGVGSAAQADALIDQLLLTYTYGAVGPVGAHPVSRDNEWTGTPLPAAIRISRVAGSPTLQDALADLDAASGPTLIEIADSRVHDLDLGAVVGVNTSDNAEGNPALVLAHSLVIRAADGERPIIRLAKPLRFRPLDPANAKDLTVRLEGLFLTHGGALSSDDALIARAAVNRLEICDSTLDPGGHRVLDGTIAGGRAGFRTAMRLAEPYGFANPADEDAFDQTPEIDLLRCVTGALLADGGYRLSLTNCVVDAGGGVGDGVASVGFALSGATGAADQSWGPPTTFQSITVFGRARLEQARGEGGLFVHRLEVLDNQEGCIKYSYFSGDADRLPQNHACVNGHDARLRFTSEVHGEPGYAQLDLASDSRVRERGPDDDAMGAFGAPLPQYEAHKWRNLSIRYREFMPADVRPLLIPVT